MNIFGLSAYYHDSAACLVKDWSQPHQTESSNAESSDYSVLKQGSSKISLMVQFWLFLRTRKKFLFLPIILMLILLGFLTFSGEGSLAPFIYTLF